MRTFEIADITAHFPLDEATGRIGLELRPTEMRPVSKAGVPDTQHIDPLTHLKIVGDPYSSGFAQGHTMRNASSVDGFKFSGQRIDKTGEKSTVVTSLADARGYRIEHRLTWHDGDAAIEVSTGFCNGSDSPVTLEMLSSFSLGGITPFHHADAPGRLRVHRFRSGWSAEGRLVTESIEQFHLEPSWAGHSLFSERFGQVGTMPVRKWFPFVAVEDTEAGVVWGAQLAWAGSWQMEIFRQGDAVCLSGGLADREFGHWMKTLAPGESLTTPPAAITCVHGSLDDLCDRLTAMQERGADKQPEVEHDLPIIFNEWCTTWGDPQHDKVLAIARRLQNTDVRYFVIDAGWYKKEGTVWSSAHGDWIPSSKLFPLGLDVTAAAIRGMGLIPGLWFEMETAGVQSDTYSQFADHFLQRDSLPVTSAVRRFWNLEDPFVIDYLTERVIGRLEHCGFGYLKVDYNETLGIGSESPDGLGEGLRRQVLASYAFFDRIRSCLPHLVIENCASGGHRLEPSMLGRSAMSSFSDAHECVEIPIIAASLHRLMLPRQSQIWAVLHDSDTMQRIAYSLAATFLGRMCLSGDILDLNDGQWDLVLRAQRLYRLAAEIIKHGKSRHFGNVGESWRHPRGWQALVRTCGKGALAVFHAFENPPAQVEVKLPPGIWKIDGQFPSDDARIDGAVLHWKIPQDFSACVLLLSRAG